MTTVGDATCLRIRLICLASIGAAAFGAGGFAAPAQAKTVKHPNLLRVWASVGPNAPLSGARIVVRSSNGRVLAQARTTNRGMRAFTLPGSRANKFPLSVTSYGGKVNGAAFHGHLRALAYSTGGNAPIVYPDLVSTSAIALISRSHGSPIGVTGSVGGPSASAAKALTYRAALSRVKATLKIDKFAPTEILRLTNNYVSWAKLNRGIHRNRGNFDGLTRDIAATAARHKSTSVFVPSRSAAGASERASKRLARSAQSSAPGGASATALCTSTIPNSNVSSGTPSTTTVENFGAIATNGLLQVAGLPSSVASGLTGMVMSPFGSAAQSGSQQVATLLTSDLQAVSTQLNCISQQISNLSTQDAAISAQVANLQFTTDVNTATSCANSITTDFGNYQWMVQYSSVDPIGPTNSYITESEGGLTSWGALTSSCGSAINNMLWGSSGGQGSAWQQLNLNTQSGIGWYTQAQSQNLQLFLSYWSTLQYQQFVLTNEYDNYYGYFEPAQGAAGAAAPAQTVNGISQCDADMYAANPNTYCAWASNVANAYPGDLYSDEVGIISNGQGVNAYPGGLTVDSGNSSNQATGCPTACTGSIDGTPIPPGTDFYNGPAPSQTTMQASWVINQFVARESYDSSHGVEGVWPFSTYSAAAAAQFNAQPINNEVNPSAVETFLSPQAVHTQIPDGASGSGPLNGPGPGGATNAAQTFVNAINAEPTSKWTNVPNVGALTGANGSTTFCAGGDQVTAQNKMVPNPSGHGPAVSAGTFNLVFQCAVNGWTGDPATGQTWTPVVGLLLGRTWWAGSSSAASYVPPQPPLSAPGT